MIKGRFLFNLYKGVDKVRVCVCMRLRVCAYVCILCVWMCVLVLTGWCMHVYVCMCVSCVYVCTCVNIYMCVRVLVCVVYVYINTNICIHITWTQTHKACALAQTLRITRARTITQTHNHS